MTQNKKFRIRKISKDILIHEAAAIAELAGGIWRGHYTPLIGSEQVEYMLAKYQSPEQIAADIKTNRYIYFTAEEDGKLIGYCACQPREDYLLLSKLYVHTDYRGNGISRCFLDEALTLRKEYDLDKIRLTVNKHNSGAIAVYQRLGFQTVDSVRTDIGEGFVMDDYIMEL
jgi:ribosomal protein S18 acetylase RimI-like enzyme